MKRNDRNGRMGHRRRVGRVTVLLSILMALLLVLLVLLFLFFVERGREQEPEDGRETEETAGAEETREETRETAETEETRETGEEIPDLESERVFAGKKKWLFYKNTSDGDTMADFYGTNLFSGEEMERIREDLVEQRDKIEAQGARFVLLIVPNKESIYFEYLPDEVAEAKARQSRTDVLVDYLEANTDLDILYMRDRFLDMKEETLLYYKTDTHWNMVGCYVALQEVLKDLYGTYVDAGEITFQEHLHDYAGDLAVMAGLGVKYGIDTVYFLGEDQAREEQKTEDSLLLVGDSFAEFLLLECQYYFKGGVINGDILPYEYNFYASTAANMGEKPDVVLWECCERHIARLGMD